MSLSDRDESGILLTRATLESNVVTVGKKVDILVTRVFHEGFALNKYTHKCTYLYILKYERTLLQRTK